jgi:hypothetical protein
MTRRDRTTGLPRQRERATAAQQRTFLGGRWGEHHTRFAILGAVALLALLVLGMIAYRWYDENVAMPNRVVLRVGNVEYDLAYFTERLPSFAQANPSLTAGFREPALLSKLEEEAIVILAARERGVDLGESAVTAWIADDLGVPVGGSGSSYDTLYRQRLRELGLSNGDYRRLATAQLADEQLIAILREERGELGEMYTLRVVSVPEQEDAQAIRDRIEAGEDMGTIAQTESNDLTTRQEDGLTEPTPSELFQDNVQAALVGSEDGTVVGPVEVGDNFWILRVERVQADGTYTDNQRDQLARLDVNAIIDETRETITIERSLGSEEIDWAYDNLDVSGS